MTFEEIVAGLNALTEEDFADEVPGRLHELTGEITALAEPEQAIPELFLLMERLPDADMGTPGPLAHTLERMAYTAELTASLRRHPTPLSVWMVNRLLNSPLPPERRHFFLGLLASVAGHPSANEPAREQARHFIDFQSQREV